MQFLCWLSVFQNLDPVLNRSVQLCSSQNLWHLNFIRRGIRVGLQFTESKCVLHSFSLVTKADALGVICFGNSAIHYLNRLIIHNMDQNQQKKLTLALYLSVITITMAAAVSIVVSESAIPFLLFYLYFHNYCPIYICKF